MRQFGSFLDASVWLRHNATAACTTTICKGTNTYRILRDAWGIINAPVLVEVAK